MRLLKPFDPWRNNLCSCQPKYSLSAYTGCGHGCLYCYASSYIPNFYRPRPKKNFIQQLKRELPKIPKNSTIAISNSSDPYQPLEKENKLTHRALELLKDFDLRINLITKSDLILEDILLLKKIKKLLISVSLTSLDPTLSKKLEPNCPPASGRLEAIKKLSKFTPVVVRIDPLIYPLNTEKIKKIVKKIKEVGAKQIVTSTYKIKPDNFKRVSTAFPQHQKIWQKLYSQLGKRQNSFIYLEKTRRKKIIEKVRQETLEAGLEFSSCRENLKELNTTTCDGIKLLGNN